MAAHVIVGAQWGDEGKGKIVDLFTRRADMVVRYQGGNNAGHTLVVERDGVQDKTVLHLIPSGILHDGKRCVVGPGVVVDPAIILGEIDALKARGYLTDDTQLVISQDATVIMPYHCALDLARERARGADKIGTTGRGIGPAYEDRVGRRAVRVRDLLDREALTRRVRAALPEKNALMTHHGLEPLDEAALVDELSGYGARLAPYVGDASGLVQRGLGGGRTVLFEGAQGTLLDVGLGTYPFVTSSHTTSGGVCVTFGVSPGGLGEVIGISKAYCTRVGAGPFPSELHDEVGERLRAAGHEFGSTTGRPRRCGWIDVAALRYAARVNGMTGLAMTKLDVLSGLDELKICVGYRGEGGEYGEPPMDADEMAGLEPVYEVVSGWSEDVRGARALSELPEAARAFVARVEELVGVPVVLVSVGPERDETIVVRDVEGLVEA
jgi:adenylosuccinate synthase